MIFRGGVTMSKADYSLEIVENRDTRYEEYEELVLRRDQLLKKTGSIQIAYTKEFGELLCRNFELKIECIKKKKTISYCRRRMNRGLPIDTARMQEEIEHEMTLYNDQLKEMLYENESAKRAVKSNKYEVIRAKKIYKRLVKLLHPDINKKTAENADLMELWERIAVAYQKTDVDALNDLEVLVKRGMEALGDDSFELQLDDIEERIERIENQINEILTTEPYTYRELLFDEEKKNEFKEKLQAEYDDFEQYLESLTKTLDEMLCEGEVKIVWQMN